jgi:hypothetical protein
MKKFNLKEYIGNNPLLKEYGGTHGRVRWFEDDEHDVLFDVEGEGEDLTKDQVDDILNAPDTDGKLEDEIRAAYADYKDYSY